MKIIEFKKEKLENNENHNILRENHENNKILELDAGITKVMKIIEFVMSK